MGIGEDFNIDCSRRHGSCRVQIERQLGVDDGIVIASRRRAHRADRATQTGTGCGHHPKFLHSRKICMVVQFHGEGLAGSFVDTGIPDKILVVIPRMRSDGPVGLVIVDTNGLNRRQTWMFDPSQGIFLAGPIERSVFVQEEDRYDTVVGTIEIVPGRNFNVFVRLTGSKSDRTASARRFAAPRPPCQIDPEHVPVPVGNWGAVGPHLSAGLIQLIGDIQRTSRGPGARDAEARALGFDDRP